MPLPTIPSGNVASAIGAGYEIANSCRFDDGSDHYVEREWDSTGNRRTWTMSFWFKGISRVEKQFCGASANADGTVGSNVWPGLIINTNASTGGIQIQHYTGSAYTALVETKALIADPNAWYHCVIRWDTTQSTDTDRLRIYLNGTLQELTTSGGSYTLPAQNLDSYWNVDTYHHRIGKGGNSNGDFDGYMAEWCFIDGSSLAPTEFGEFDEDSPTIWKPKDVSGLTFGTNGFYLDFEDSSALGNDVSGNNNDFGTVVNLAATDQATDTPTNNFATMNPLDNFYYGATFSEGNLKLVQPSSTECYTTSTIAVSSGKWYWEVKITASGSSKDFVGIADKVADDSDFSPYSGNSNMISYYGSNGDSKAGSTSTNSSWGDTFTTGDIIGVALDLTNNKLYFSKNGTWQDSGDPTSGSTGTGALTVPASPADGVWYAQFSNIHNTASTFEINFGNPTFSISSGNADDNGYGNFEYDVPSGYYALCTKNLAEFGG